MDPGVNSRLDKRESQSPIPRPAALARRGSACDRPARYDPEKISPPLLSLRLKKLVFIGLERWRARRDSNPRPSGS